MDHHLPHYSVSSVSLFNNPKKKPKLKLTSPFHFQDQTNIARPCTECGKTFSSWKALFGHMRCHPERQWRGINPPPNFLRHNNNNFTIVNPDHINSNHDRDDDDEVASCLLMLANGPPLTPHPDNNNLSFDFDSDFDCRSPTTSLTTTVHHVPPLGLGLNLGLGTAPHYCSHHVDSAGRFKCSGCRKVFGSHQALGGHRASHKNVKGCFAITKKSTSSSSELVQDNASVTGGDHHCNFGDHNSSNNTNSNNVNNVHKCSICLRVFSSGQALGGHMRCHWEKKADYEQDQSLNTRPFDLNLPAPIHDDSDHTVRACGDDSLDLTLGV